MLDRMSLSMKNGWMDDENRAYIIYTIENIREDLGCSKEKAVKVLAELDAGKGIGIVEKIRRGLGKPDIIYVKNFIIQDEEGKESRSADVSTEVGKTDFKKSENQNLIILTIIRLKIITLILAIPILSINLRGMWITQERRKKRIRLM